jgi:hypothetical protein
MKPLKLIVTLAAAVCVLCSAHAQQQTNTATFTATMTLQGPEGPTTAATLSSMLNTAGLITELGDATGNTFSKAAKLQVISGNGPNAQFNIADGATSVLIPTNIVSIFPTTGHSIVSGKETNTSLHEKQLMIFEMDFNDIGLGGTDLQFSLRGMGTIMTTETINSSTTSAKMTMLGDGSQGGTNFVAAASLSGSGH